MHFVYGIFYALTEVYKQKMTSLNSPLKNAPAETLSFYRIRFMTAQCNIPFSSWSYKHEINCFLSTVTINNVARLNLHSKAVMKTLINLLVIALIANNTAFANTDLSFIKSGMTYTELKATLIEKGWKPSKNKRIALSSLYALEIYEQGMEEVIDCISMELDACKFRFTQGNQVIDIKTITRQLTVDSFHTYQKR